MKVAFSTRSGGLTPVYLLLGSVLLSGCGYTVGYRTPPGVKTVAVPIFHNATFPLRRELEFELTSRVREEIQNRTSLKIVPESEADWVLRGSILEFRERIVAEGKQDRIVEGSVIALVELTMEDYRNGFLLTRPVRTEEPFSGEQAEESLVESRRRAIGNLAERIVAAVEYWDDYGESAPVPP